MGLSTAIKVQEHGGYRVTVVAEIVPGDPKSIRYTSSWAVSFILLSMWPREITSPFAMFSREPTTSVWPSEIPYSNVSTGQLLVAVKLILFFPIDKD